MIADLQAMADELIKISKADKDKPSALRTIGESTLGFGLGYGLGAGAGRLIEGYAKKQGKHMPTVAGKLTALGIGGAAASYPMWKHYEAEKLKRGR